jgi:hypothetical protein
MLLGRAALILVFWGAVVARAQPEAWIEIEAPRSCERAAAGLRERAREALLGQPIAELRARVRIGREDGAYRATVETLSGATLRGSKQISAPTCAEVVEAVVVVLALALSEQQWPADDARHEPSEAGPAAHSEVATAQADSVDARLEHSAAARPDDQEELDEPRDAGEPRGERLRISLRAGVDSGTLPVRTALVGMGLGYALGPLELQALLGFGLPYVEETVTDEGASERLRGDFGVLDLGACYGLGARWRLSACAAGELGVVRSARVLRADAAPDVLTRRVAARLAGVLTARLAYRAHRVQPELEVSGVGVALSGPDGAAPLAMRVGVGLGLQF